MELHPPLLPPLHLASGSHTEASSAQVTDAARPLLPWLEGTPCCASWWGEGTVSIICSQRLTEHLGHSVRGSERGICSLLTYLPWGQGHSWARPFSGRGSVVEQLPCPPPPRWHSSPSPTAITTHVIRHHCSASPAATEVPQLRATGLVPALVSDSPFCKTPELEEWPTPSLLFPGWGLPYPLAAPAPSPTSWEL